MASSRRSRKHHKLGADGLAQRESALDSYELKPVPPSSSRETFPARRLKLAKQFAKLPKSERQARKAEFRRRLKEICATDLEFKGYWQIKFESLLPKPGNTKVVVRKKTGSKKRSK